MRKTALITVFDKGGIVEFASSLVKLDWDIIASSGTAKLLNSEGVPARDVAELTGSEPKFGHRVVTLSQEVHGGLMSRPIEEDIKELEKLGLPRIDLACIGFYPVAGEIAKPGATNESVTEMTDVGGPSAAHSAAKGSRIVVIDPKDRQRVIDQLRKYGHVLPETRRFFRAKADFLVSQYCMHTAEFHSNGIFTGMFLRLKSKMRKAENLNQNPAHLFSLGTDDPLALDRFTVLGNPGYVNATGHHRSLEMMCLMAETFRANFNGVPNIVIACKHGNPCGVGIHWDSTTMGIMRAMLGNAKAVMGAEIMTNFYVGPEAARSLFTVSEDLRSRVKREKWGGDVIIAPGFSGEGTEILGKRERRHLLANPALVNPAFPPDEWAWRPVRGGMLRQKAPRFVFDLRNIEEQVGKDLNPVDLASVVIAFSVAWRANSNTIALAKGGMLIGLCAGEQDRRTAAEFALLKAKKAGHDPRGSFFASDGFFPFAKRVDAGDELEATEMLAEAGCRGGIVPADGRRLAEVKEFFKETEMTVFFVHPENRGFSQH
ncbi:MAG: hypothetical protein ISS93_01165 [Candidatus Aenigmarchaeota archaeon]|nr:hypothetical protein [Candidatus Aenigmarchaeota archaeon]